MGRVRSIGVDAQCDLLRHRAAGHEDRCRFAQQLGDLFLKVANEFALPVHIGRQSRIGVRGQIASMACAV